MNGYKNAPDIAPQVGDVVECGLPGDTVVVHALSNDVEGSPFAGMPANIVVTNCSVDGRLYLNAPHLAVLVRTVDGREPPNVADKRHGTVLRDGSA